VPHDEAGAPVRIVLDTNVVLSALLWRGTPYRLLQTIRRLEHIQIFTSAALLEELGEVLIRPVPMKRLVLLGRVPHEVLADYIDAVELVTPLSTLPVIVADPDDDEVIAAAVAAEADLLVSGDRHLLGLGSHRTFRIVMPAEAVQLIGGT
jgi:putative PIN family toxin of toxin-antitoxin system